MTNILGHTPIWSNDYLALYTFSEKQCGLFISKTEYILIEHFKNAFDQALIYAKSNNWNYFIFDKSNLNVFHQPSMEWYYTTWKKQLLNLGVKTHFKILPKEPWFKASVEAGLVEIKEKHPDFDFSAFKVIYVSNIDEALLKISAKD